MPFDLMDPQFWQEDAVQKEMTRVFEICHGCRRCFNLCPSFVELFNRIDAKEEDPRRVGREDMSVIVDLCYECKLCYNHCPYTPPHRWDVDFPRLMLRAKAAEAKKRGVKFEDRILGDTDFIGKCGRLAAPFSNWMNRFGLFRRLLAKILKVHAKRNLPDFARTSFESWFKKRSRGTTHQAAGNGKVVFFYTCYVNNNDPEIGKAALEVLERNGVEVRVPKQVCCGMPFLDGGDITGCQKKIERNLKSLVSYVDEGYEIVTPGPTCSYMLKMDMPVMNPSQEAKKIASKTFDLSEYLMRLHARGRLDTRFRRREQKIAYHLPCHLKAQNIGYKSRDLMALIPGTQVQLIERCSGHDGTWGMKQDFYEMSMGIGKKLFEETKDSRADVVASDCPLAGLQLTQGTKRPVKHPIQIVRDAYE